MTCHMTWHIYQLIWYPKFGINLITLALLISQNLLKANTENTVYKMIYNTIDQKSRPK